MEEKKKEVLVLCSQDGDWEGLFIDGTLIDEGHTLGEGNARKYWVSMANEHGFSAEDIKELTVSNELDNYLCLRGCFPVTLSEIDNPY